MSERIQISKKLRFEVFKRDSFTCQYCGAKAPDVILHVDHINPVSKGGGNDLLNLITACISCNGGKSDRLLSDRSEIDKQRAQLEELEERRQQLEWMLQWRDQLASFQQSVVEKVSDYFDQKCQGWFVNDAGRRDIEKWLKTFSVDAILSAIDAATLQYLAYREDGSVTEDSVAHAWAMVPRIAGAVRRDAEKPWLKDVCYVRATLRNRLSYVNEYEVLGLVENAILTGCDTSWVKEQAKHCRSWTHFKNTLLDAIAEIEGDQ